MDNLEETIVELSCYEPAGQSVPITEADILGHTLVTGGSGSGKTTRVIYPMLRQITEHRASDPLLKSGLCVLDTKADGEVEAFLQKACLEAGRKDDLHVVDCYTGGCIDLLYPYRKEGLKGLKAVADLLSSSTPTSEANRYWEITFSSLILLALRFYHLTEDDHSYDDMVDFMRRYLLQFDLMNPVLKMKMRELLESNEADYEPEINDIVNETIAAHKMWSILDVRTRSIFQSMAAPLIEGLSNPTARKIFSEGPPFDMDMITVDGAVVLLSVDAIQDPEVAALATTVAKGQLYERILERKFREKVSHRIAGLVADDWPLCATGGINSRYSDVSALSMIRSRGGFVLAATQGTAALDLRIGVNSRRAAMSNFANLFFLRGRDAELDAYAAAYFGEKRRVHVDRTVNDRPSSATRKDYPILYERETFVPAVPVGSLARLPLGEAYALIGGDIYAQPLCLVPEYAPQQKQEEDNEQIL